jgi:hypothetical protein
MTHMDFRSARAVMDMRVDEAQQQAEARHLRRRHGVRQPDWLPRQGCWLLCQLGHLLVALGERLEQYGLPQSLPLEWPIPQER